MRKILIVALSFICFAASANVTSVAPPAVAQECPNGSCPPK